MNPDADILLWINGHSLEWLDEVMWTVSQTKTWIPIYILLAGFIVKKFRNWKTVLLVLIGFGIAVGLSDFICSGLLKPLVCRLRPTHEPALDPLHLVNGYVGGRYGFCSSHAANTMAVGLLFALLYKDARATISLMTWVALVCYSRMYLGVHYPTDIMAGLAVGSLWAGLAFVALKYWLRVAGVAAQQGGS